MLFLKLDLFTERLLRYLASFQMIKEDKENTFRASNVTRALATPGAQASIHHQ